jgi:hypothetical protein
MMLASPCKLPNVWIKYIENSGNEVALRVNSKDPAPEELGAYMLRDSFTETEYAQPSIVDAMVHLLHNSLQDASLADCTVFAFVCGSTVPLVPPAKLSSMMPEVIGEQAQLGLTQDFASSLRVNFFAALQEITDKVPLWAQAHRILGPWAFQPCSQFIVVSRKLAELLCRPCYVGSESGWGLGEFAHEYSLIVKEMHRRATGEEHGNATFCCLAPDEMVWTPFLLLQLWHDQNGRSPPSEEWIRGQLEKWVVKPMHVDMVVAKHFDAMCQQAGFLAHWYQGSVVDRELAFTIVKDEDIMKRHWFVRKVEDEEAAIIITPYLTPYLWPGAIPAGWERSGVSRKSGDYFTNHSFKRTMLAELMNYCLMKQVDPNDELASKLAEKQWKLIKESICAQRIHADTFKRMDTGIRDDKGLPLHGPGYSEEFLEELNAAFLRQGSMCGSSKLTQKQQRQLDALREQLQEEWFSQWRLVFNLDSGESGSGSVSGSNGASSAAGRTAASAASKYSKGR